MCFVREWSVAFSDRQIAPALLTRITCVPDDEFRFVLDGGIVLDGVVSVARGSNLPSNSEINLFNQTTSLHASVTAIYSASVDDSATVVCLCDFHDTAPPNKNTYPVVDLRVSISPPQSESLYLRREVVVSKVKARFWVAFRYRRVHLTAEAC